MKRWLFEIIVGVALLALPAILYLTFPTMTSNYWFLITIIIVVGAVFVFIGDVKRKAHDEGQVGSPFRKSSNTNYKGRDYRR
jgi:hypothetical protein